jgi:hypothetical protein
MMATASVRDVCADILDGLAHTTIEPVAPRYEDTRAWRLGRGAETLRWTESYERGESVEAMRDEIQALREQVADLQDDALDVATATQRVDNAEAELKAEI